MKIESILIFSFSHIGDAVLSTAVVPPLQEHFPDGKISVLVGPKARGILSSDPRLDETIVYDNRGYHSGLNGKLRLIKELSARKFDLCIDLRDSLWSRFIGTTRWGMPLLQRAKPGYRGSHAVDRYLGILRARGIEPGDAAPEIHLLPAEVRFADDFLSRHGITAGDLVVGIHPGGGWPYKLWDAKQFAALGDLLIQKRGARVLIFAGPGETPLQDQIVSLMESPPILVKDVGLRELAALTQRCQLYIGNDTGPMHIAAAVGTQVVAIFGPTDAARTGPYGSSHTVIAKGVHCSPCHPGRNPGGCGGSSCMAMEAVSLDEVANAVERILDNG